MSTLGFGSLSPAAAAPAPAAVEDTSSHWAPHGAALTAFVVGINVLVIVLIFFFFCRFFSRKGEDDSASDGADDPLPVASPWASRRRRRREAPAARALDDVASALPVYVYSSSADDAVGGGKTKAPTECAVCIVELRDGDSARRLPRCGHRFHADCVGAWLRLHATCPLCRASVVAPAAGGESARNAKDDVGVGADCPV